MDERGRRTRAYDAAGIAKALADPTRRAILAQLTRGEAMISDLARPFALSQPAISRHIKVLEGAGLILRRAEGTRSVCRLQPGALDELMSWLGQLREALEANYSRLDRVLAEMSTPTSKERKRS